MRTQYNPNTEESEFILTAEEMKDNDISIRSDERNKTVNEMAERLNVKFVELPLDDMIVSNILKYISKVAKQMKGEYVGSAIDEFLEIRKGNKNE